MFFSQVLNGLQIGAIYALVALGYSMVYGIISLLNFAHGDIIMIGAYAVWFLMTSLGVHPILSILLVIILCTALGMGIEKVAYKPLRSAPRLSLLITAIGVSYLLENLMRLIAGTDKKTIEMPFSLGTVGDVSGVTILTLSVSAACMIGITLLVNKTKIGKAMRAVSEDTETARLMGINPNAVISVTFALGSALAGIGSVLYSCMYPQAFYTMGSMLGIKAFSAAVLGGIGSLPGAMIGGLVIGLAETFAKAIGQSQWADAITFVILILVLLIKPSGILGKKRVEKV